MLTLHFGRLGLSAVLAAVLAAALAQDPVGATFAAADSYRLPAGVVIPTDLYVVANNVVIEGEVRGHLAVIARRATVSGAVGGSANVAAARIELQGARLGVVRTVGATLAQPRVAPAGDADMALPVSYADATRMAQEDPPSRGPDAIRENLPVRDPATTWLRPTALLLVGFAALAAMLLALVPRVLVRPAAVLDERPWRALLVGGLVVLHFLFIPLGTIALALLVGYFWDWFVGMLLLLFMLTGFGLVWLLSPLVTGVWAGRRLNRAFGRAPYSRPLLVLGVVLVALAGQLPGVGWVVYLASLVLATGAVAVAAGRAARGPLAAPQLPAALASADGANVATGADV